MMHQNGLPDLIVHAESRIIDGETSFLYTLNANRPSLNILNRKFVLPAIKVEPETYLRHNVSDTLEARGSRSQKEAMRRFASQGTELFLTVFPVEMQRLLWEIHKRVDTLLIQSDIPWIPWEVCKLIHPEAREPGPFFCETFAMTHWVHSEMPPRSFYADRMGLILPELAEPEAAQKAAKPSKEEEVTPTGLAKPFRQDTSVLIDREGLLSVESPRHAFPSQAVDLGQMFQTETIEPSEEFVLKAMAEDDRDIWHFCGHLKKRSGDFQAGMQGETVLLNNGQELCASDLNHVRFRGKPLVFWNACAAGQATYGFTKLSGWGPKFIEIGAGAFIGVRYGVTALDAYEFSIVIYGHLKSGIPLGKAVQLARASLRDFGSHAWLAYTVYGHPNATFTTTANPKPDTTVSPEVLSKILDQDDYLEERTEEFIGRKHLFKKVDRWVRESRKGTFLLIAEPGIGKSAFASKLVRTNHYVHHFNRQGTICSPAQFRENICAQLIAEFGLPYQSLPRDVEQKPEFLQTLLFDISRRPGFRKLVLVIDALDEANREGLDPLDNELGLPGELPDGVFLLMTARPIRKDLTLSFDHLSTEEEVRQDDPSNLEDIRDYLRFKLSQHGSRNCVVSKGVTDDYFVEKLTERSEGNFMYLRYVLPVLLKEGIDHRLESLPRGLEAYYEDHWQRMRMQNEDAWFEYKHQVLIAISMINPPVSFGFLEHFMGTENLGRTQTVLDEWSQFLHRQKINGVDWYRFYHQSFNDFLKKKQADRAEKIDSKDIGIRVARALRAQLGL